MGETVNAAILGAGWPGQAHARALAALPGVKLAAVADPIPARRDKLAAEHKVPRAVAGYDEIIKDPAISAVCVCLPTHLHAAAVTAALKAGKHVLCESPPGVSVAQAKQIEKAVAKAGRVLLYALPRRFGAAEMAARQSIEKGYAGDVYHVRASWTRTRGVPIGTGGWYTDKAQSGGGAMLDLGLHLLDLGWHLLGEPRPLSASAVSHQRFRDLAPADKAHDVEDAAFALLRFEGGRTLELGASWALNQAPHHQGTICRAHGQTGAVDVYTPQGAVLYRHFTPAGQSKPTALKGPKLALHAALARHFRDCIAGKSTPAVGPRHGVLLMQMMDAIYRSAQAGKSVEIRTDEPKDKPAAQSPQD
jgi:predicted dehydrogenase